MSAKDTLRCNKTDILTALCADYRLILNKVHEKNLITQREYNNLKSINKEDVEGHAVELMDKIMNKGEDSCQYFMDLLQTDKDIINTYPKLKSMQLNDTCHLVTCQPVQESADATSPQSKRLKREERYQLKSQPVGLCVIINNDNFMDGTMRSGTNKDAQCLAEVFTWLRFRVLMCKDQTRDQMERALGHFASLSDPSRLQEFNVKEWIGSGFAEPQQTPLKHGDAFICCILSHGLKGVVIGTDRKPLSIKQITQTFKTSDQSALTGKPKVFLIQACQGPHTQHGVLLEDLEADASPSLFIPEEADVLVAFATVEDHVSFRHKTDGSWFIQSVCQQLKEGCLRHDDITTILHRVNDEVSQKEGPRQCGAAKQMPEVRFTLRKTLVLSPPEA
ncbi:caspase-8 [Hippoglossus stenolepis]|uniref:caspase-8 n=1 Tax=Hippoglossus stenolepis TaxID=195615 RepID=UPI00159C64D2|nr:caspase-8 [Hippoglossus stenolepis]